MKLIAASSQQEPYMLISEFMPLGSLQDFLQTHGILSMKNVLQLAEDILRGLIYLHEKRIIHRDLKPGNILLHGDISSLHAKITGVYFSFIFLYT